MVLTDLTLDELIDIIISNKQSLPSYNYTQKKFEANIETMTASLHDTFRRACIVTINYHSTQYKKLWRK